MKNCKRTCWGFLILLSGLWLAADALPSSAFMALRASLINYTGIIGIGVMSAALILAARPIVSEPVLGGLDKMYRLHKWLGITGLVAIIAHWLLRKCSRGWSTWAG